MVADISFEFVDIVFEQMIVYIAPVIDMVYTTIFSFITLNKNLINCNSFVDYKSLADYTSLVIQNVAVEAMIVFIAGRVAI